MKYLLLSLILLFSSSITHAGQSSAILNIRVNIIQCGEIERIVEACARETACCNFVPDEIEEDIKLTENTETSGCVPGEIQTENGLYPVCIETNE